MNEDYEIGYGKPPKDQQFKKGQSGNPYGRPKGSKNTYTYLQQILNQKITITDNGRQIRCSKKATILTQLVNKAVKGDIKAINAILPHMLMADIKEEETRQVIKMLNSDDKAIIERYLQKQKAKDDNE